MMLRIAQLLCIGYLVLAVGLIILTPVIGPFGSAPFQLPLGPSHDPVVVRIAYGTEKRAWLEEAARRFAETDTTLNGHPIQIELQGIGSREMVTEIVAGNLQPVVASPASSIQIELLRAEWETRYNSNIYLEGAAAPQALVLTPLVLVGWQERADVLWPTGPQDFWNDLHNALADPQGWSTYGHPEWGFVKFGHTSPELSNSGIQTLVLLAYGYANKSRDLNSQDILDPGFQTWLTSVEQSVLEFGDSSGTFMTNMVRFGPSKYDFVMVYENLAIEEAQAAENRWGPIRVYYPPENIVSDHPYAILNGEWVSADQKEAALRFRDFLLSPEIQELALQFGFRPANTQVGFDSPDSPFDQYAVYGIQRDIPSVVEVPQAQVLNELIAFWHRGDFE